jgi:hypothetical protein
MKRAVFFKSMKMAPPKPKKPKAPAEKPTKKDEAKAEPKLGELGNPSFVALLSLLQQHDASCQFGQHNVEPGHHVAFEAGAFQGAGEVTATGEHGATVKDTSGREHRVHWHEVTGRNDGGKKAKDAK